MELGDILYGDEMIYYYKKLKENGEIEQLVTYEIFPPIFTEEEKPYYIELTKEQYETQLKIFIEENSLKAIVDVEKLEVIV